MTTNNIGAMDAQANGAKLYHLELRKRTGGPCPEHYYFPTLEALKLYAEKEVDGEDWMEIVSIMEIGDDGYFVDTWECLNVCYL